MSRAFFVSDLHGKKERVEKLIERIRSDKPDIVFVGGDLVPHPCNKDFERGGFLSEFLLPEFLLLRREMHTEYPIILMILGNDDPKSEETILNCGEKMGLWHYINNKHFTFRGYRIFGYNYVPPTPFQLKDWEKYDVSRFVDPGCVSPEEGSHTFSVNESEIRNSTIQKDLEELAAEFPMDKSIFLFHAPPYQTNLDRAALDGKMIDHTPLDVHVGSIAVKRFIEKKKPIITMHGHIHESARITKAWVEKIGSTICFNASHDGSELALIKFELEAPEGAERELI